MSTGTQTEVVMPQMGVSVSEGTVTKWLKQVGEAIGRDEPLLEISTDKVDTEVPSPAEGVVARSWSRKVRRWRSEPCSLASLPPAPRSRAEPAPAARARPAPSTAAPSSVASSPRLRPEPSRQPRPSPAPCSWPSGRAAPARSGRRDRKR